MSSGDCAAPNEVGDNGDTLDSQSSFVPDIGLINRYRKMLIKISYLNHSYLSIIKDIVKIISPIHKLPILQYFYV